VWSNQSKIEKKEAGINKKKKDKQGQKGTKTDGWVNTGSKIGRALAVKCGAAHCGARGQKREMGGS